ncbi:hypothetical protein ACIBEJ_31205 [Nonomuraea sp. NPDC050790]|uniref:hypothetical protein n=1 Tax=Nonomuraea sp. NPDC050790 TaxID=3364371 RepID=UPI003793B33F
MRRLTAVLAAVVLCSGCSTIQEAGAILSATEACDEAAKVADELLTKIPSLTGDPPALDKALDAAADRLKNLGVESGNATLNDALGSLARSYQEIEVTDPAAAVQKVRSETTASLQVVTRACAF